MIVVIGAAVGLGIYIMGFAMGRRYAQQQIKEMRLDAGLNPETGEEYNEYS